ncbi:MAG: cyclic nucleotide-binding domain-containing protein, partial [Acidimicrobiia bacterium]
MELTAGEELFREGEPAARFYLIREGRVALSVRDEVQGDRVVQEAGPGDFLGETGLLLDVEHTATARAVGDVGAWYLDANDFLELLGRYFDLEEALGSTVEERVRKHDVLATAGGSSQWLDVEVGDPAPDFTLEAVRGGTVSLSDHRGQTVVLWFSRGYNCPFCRK